MADDHTEALRSSVTRLRSIAAALDNADLNHRAYPSEWTVADVLSHLGSGAVITRRRLDDTLAGHTTPDDYAPGVWDEWNAKAPAAQRDDALAADAELLARLDELTPDDRAGFSSAMGPLTLDFEQFVGMRLNEHALHTWDIEVARDPTAVLPQEVAALVVDNLDLIARFTAKPTGDTTTVTIATTDPARRYTIDLTPESVSFGPATAKSPADLTLPAEAFARLVYGRLAQPHTPRDSENAAVTTLREVFPGP
jgi:uncharacterized protein (TIGR03083 family)